MQNDKKLQAKELYFQTNLSKTQIAESLGVPRRTLHFWIKQNNWDRLKNAAEHLPSLLAENCSHILGNFTRSLLNCYNDEPLSLQHTEILYKLTMTIQKLKNRATISDSMEMFALFQDGLRKQNPALADTIMPYIEQYISKRARIHQHHLLPEDFNIDGRARLKPFNENEARLDYFDMQLWDSPDGKVPEEWGPNPDATRKDAQQLAENLKAEKETQQPPHPGHQTTTNHKP